MATPRRKDNINATTLSVAVSRYTQPKANTVTVSSLVYFYVHHTIFHELLRHCCKNIFFKFILTLNQKQQGATTSATTASNKNNIKINKLQQMDAAMENTRVDNKLHNQPKNWGSAVTYNFAITTGKHTGGVRVAFLKSLCDN